MAAATVAAASLLFLVVVVVVVVCHAPTVAARSAPTRYRLSLEKNGNVATLKRALRCGPPHGRAAAAADDAARSAVSGVPATQMVVADIYVSRVHADLEDEQVSRRLRRRRRRRRRRRHRRRPGA